MNILAFDTSGPHCCAALLCADGRMLHHFEAMEKGQAERLFPILEALLDAAGLRFADLGALGVGIGPGNFTGLRLSIAAARGLALGLSIPAIGVSIFDALAYGHPRPLLVAQDARHGLVYTQFLDESAPHLCPIEQVEPAQKVIGSAACLLAQKWGAEVLSPLYPLSQSIARIAAARHAPHVLPAPLYLRSADAAPASDLPPVMLDA